MTAHKHNNLLKSMLQRELNFPAASLPKTSAKPIEKPRQEDSGWFVVATDGSTSIIRCKSAYKIRQPSQPHQAVAQDRTEPPKYGGVNTSDDSNEGVDLSHLDMEKDTASKLIAGMKAMGPGQSAGALQAQITMPSAMTDMQEIFKTDNVCMVCHPPERNEEPEQKFLNPEP